MSDNGYLTYSSMQDNFKWANGKSEENMSNFKAILIIILKIIWIDVKCLAIDVSICTIKTSKFLWKNFKKAAKKTKHLLAELSKELYWIIHSFIVRMVLAFLVRKEKAKIRKAENREKRKKKYELFKEDFAEKRFNFAHSFRRLLYNIFIWIALKREKTSYPELYRGEEIVPSEDETDEKDSSQPENLIQDSETLPEEFSDKKQDSENIDNAEDSEANIVETESSNTEEEIEASAENIGESEETAENISEAKEDEVSEEEPSVDSTEENESSEEIQKEEVPTTETEETVVEKDSENKEEESAESEKETEEVLSDDGKTTEEEIVLPEKTIPEEEKRTDFFQKLSLFVNEKLLTKRKQDVTPSEEKQEDGLAEEGIESEQTIASDTEEIVEPITDKSQEGLTVNKDDISEEGHPVIDFKSVEGYDFDYKKTSDEEVTGSNVIVERSNTSSIDEEDDLQEETSESEASVKKTAKRKKKANPLIVIPSWLLCTGSAIACLTIAESSIMESDLGQGFLSFSLPRNTACILANIGIFLSVLVISETISAIFRKIKTKSIRRKSMFSRTATACMLTCISAFCLIVKDGFDISSSESLIPPESPLNIVIYIIAALCFIIAAIEMMIAVNNFFEK